MNSPIAFRWDGEAMVPLPRFTKVCDTEFVCGETYILEAHEERSSKTHRHLFAQLADAWANLPENYEGRFPTPEHFRKWLLIKAGYANHMQHVCGSRNEASRLRAAISPMDPYAIVTQDSCVVDVFTAQSMSTRAMDKKTFQAAKTRVFELIDEMLGVAAGETERNAAEAA